MLAPVEGEQKNTREEEFTWYFTECVLLEKHYKKRDFILEGESFTLLLLCIPRFSRVNNLHASAESEYDDLREI